MNERIHLNCDATVDTYDVVFDGYVIGFVGYDNTAKNYELWYINKRGHVVSMRFRLYTEVKAYIFRNAELLRDDAMKLLKA